MTPSAKRIAILGSTGSIGRQALEVIASQPGLSACALAAGSNHKLLAEQARRFEPEIVALSDERAARQFSSLVDGIDVLTGSDAMCELVRRSRCDVLLSGVVGSTGLAPTLEGIRAGATLAIANKETLVMAGAIVMPAARDAGVSVLPVDSEHSAIFQCLSAGRAEEIRRVIITSSGGALRDFSDAEAAAAGVDDALNHPTWRMGPKVTIDSATLMNKALEMIEAHWLFDLPAERIEVVIHPESIVHAVVEFSDGSCVAQMARPDMTGPIAYALGYPDRLRRDVEPLDLASIGSLTFRPPSQRAQKAIELGYEVIRRGGTSGAVLNGANEAAVEAFLNGRIRFGDIVPLVEETLNQQADTTEPTLQTLSEADIRARRYVAGRVNDLGGDKDIASEYSRPGGDKRGT
ncbi:MAG: 1-deoxy-D-xylulose-5-phosphate reductoisomerase [Phycisphaerae bacterium]